MKIKRIMTTKHILCILFSLALPVVLSVSLPIRAEEMDTHRLEQKLNDNKAIIAKLKKRIEEKQAKQNQEETQLKECDVKIASLTQSLKTTEISIRNTEQEILQLKESLNTVNTSMKEKQDRLSQQMKATYLFQKNKPFKLFLSQQNPFQLARLLRYYHYLEKYNVEAFTRLLNEYQQLSLSCDEKEALTGQLTQLRATKKNTLTDLEQQKMQRQKVLTEIKQELSKTKKYLSQSERNEKELVEQLKYIQTTLLSHPFKERAFFKPKPFTEAKGRLFWPIRNKINPSLRSPIMIKANSGAPVYSTYDGRVVFADHLRGFGLLIIIDHHEGYMSLYGHNQILYKNIGDKVQKGNLIARVGTGGTEEESGLYFEIRRNGKPETLVNWFK